MLPDIKFVIHVDIIISMSAPSSRSRTSADGDDEATSVNNPSAAQTVYCDRVYYEVACMLTPTPTNDALKQLTLTSFLHECDASVQLEVRIGIREASGNIATLADIVGRLRASNLVDGGASQMEEMSVAHRTVLGLLEDACIVRASGADPTDILTRLLPFVDRIAYP
ncbi:hypothetical protein BJV82DRAFT_708582 [Fennellomyces sp. T-0311]|nr:hypothetical protein BJV82DRAFT_708582 [Fennellomyces sp. T-0311]